MPNRLAHLAALLLTLVPALAKAEFGASYSRALETISIDAKRNYDPNGFLGPEYGQNTLTLQTNRVTLWDTNGWIAAVGGTAMSRSTAREQAVRSALIRGERTASYSYEVIPPVPGYTTTLSLVWGEDAAGLSRNGTPVAGATAKLAGLWVSAAFGNLSLGPVLVGFSMDGGGLVASWAGGGGTSGIEPSFARIAIQVAATAQYSILPNLSVGLRLGLDPLLSPLRALLGSFSEPAIDAGALFQLQYRPLPFVMLFAEASAAVSSEFSLRGMTHAYAQLGLAVLLPLGER